MLCSGGMSREYTYYVREFRTREDVQRFISQEINDPACPDEVVSVVLEHGRGWVLIGKSPRPRVAAESARMSEEMPTKRPREPVDGGRSYGGGARAYGPGAKSGPPDASPPAGGGERAIDTRGRRGTGRFKLP